jgi:hypothetical protein
VLEAIKLAITQDSIIAKISRRNTKGQQSGIGQEEKGKRQTLCPQKLQNDTEFSESLPLCHSHPDRWLILCYATGHNYR